MQTGVQQKEAASKQTGLSIICHVWRTDEAKQWLAHPHEEDNWVTRNYQFIEHFREIHVEKLEGIRTWVILITKEANHYGARLLWSLDLALRLCLPATFWLLSNSACQQTLGRSAQPSKHRYSRTWKSTYTLSGHIILYYSELSLGPIRLWAIWRQSLCILLTPVDSTAE